MESDPIVIISAVRTPIGAMLGALSGLEATDLGTVVIKAAVERAGIAPNQVQEVLMGCVLPAGQGQAPARQATLKAGLPTSTGATTLNKMCGSGHFIFLRCQTAVIAGKGRKLRLAPREPDWHRPR